jgi:hypothetical protein
MARPIEVGPHVAERLGQWTHHHPDCPRPHGHRGVRLRAGRRPQEIRAGCLSRSTSNGSRTRRSHATRSRVVARASPKRCAWCGTHAAPPTSWQANTSCRREWGRSRPGSIVRTWIARCERWTDGVLDQPRAHVLSLSTPFTASPQRGSVPRVRLELPESGLLPGSQSFTGLNRPNRLF